ncbi:NAD-dependent succinate-semialdehyde dehydrogenase [Oceanobacillus profundus]|uniref:NAD-dependent succinate-semialdehyde dehydrogenase n=1 Tax=Oceanobacillus profundus TaxID=372463 RepID=A0A417YAV8_9BACI|nr:NAD-dependent succinate-semialdehyde dehydrogenase [Oceanobacillus profundus]MBR3119634.1 NAD-dependent succinate-semialdehyde dehydrogenase [Oceanobacillus sp.]MCM3398379.1 NAD-dependent succinate-semialdehyde dehydrogenase [Oceanobacillus profundus]MDO6451368.1 NAD-dependent succinate-semialdehyde dehydrogenase [Oceanobacillus profundus]RHW29838.1 NAD-dependent succinate-semialdehyde dehydrogenase [Oceanobacillus profundus]
MSETKAMIDVVNPANGEKIESIPRAGKEEATAAVDRAYKAFQEWSERTAEERSELLMKWHHLIQEEVEDIAKTMTLEQGKPLEEAKGEVTYANNFISWYAEEGKRVYGETIPASARNKRIMVHKQPVGVIAAITPWNFPAAMITRKVAPALAAGCTAVVKPASATPLTAIKLGNLAQKAGIPEGVLEILPGDSGEISDAWMEDTRVRKVSFTGSTEVGKVLMRKSADTVKKISLELGGHAPLIVMNDADLDKAAEGAVRSKFRNAGQTCVCSNRIYVHEDVVDAFTDKFKQKVSQLKVGNGMDEGVDIGPLIDKDAYEKVNQHLKDALDQGAELIHGGESYQESDGYFVEPTVLKGVTEEMLCMNEETFGPLAPISTFTTESEVIDRANNTPYGLAAYLFTESISKAVRIGEKLEYGIVGINDGMPSTVQAPFGGFKESGLGREGGHHGMEEYLEVKYFSIGI